MGTFFKCGITNLALFVLFLCPFSMHSATTATTGIKVNVTIKNISPTDVFSTDAVTSTSAETSMNPDNTKKALHTTDVKRKTKKIKTSLFVPVTTKEPSLISTESLSTISVHPNISQTTLPTKKTTDRPINPAVMVVALTSSLTFLIVIVGFFLRRYTKSRNHCDAKRGKTLPGKQRMV